MAKRRLYSVLLISLLLPACGMFDGPAEEVAMTVGARKVTADELKRDIKVLTSGMGMSDQDLKEVMGPLLSKLADHYLILEYGRQEGITVSEEELASAVEDIKGDYPEERLFQEMLLRQYLEYEQWKEGLRQQLLVKKIIDKVSENIGPVTFDEIRSFFDAHQKEFERPEMVNFRQIVTRTKGEAAEIRRLLKAGGDFGELARERSIAPEAEQGGAVGWVSKGALHGSIEKALFSLRVGEISQVTETPYGYHIFQVQSKRKKGLWGLSQVMGEIESRLMQEKREVFHQRWLQQLRGLFPVKINEDILAKLELG